jgi:hypothetical protein
MSVSYVTVGSGLTTFNIYLNTFEISRGHHFKQEIVDSRSHRGIADVYGRFFADLNKLRFVDENQSVITAMVDHIHPDVEYVVVKLHSDGTFEKLGKSVSDHRLVKRQVTEIAHKLGLIALYPNLTRLYYPTTPTE